MLSNVRIVDCGRNTEGTKLGCGPDPREHEELGRVDRSRRDDDFSRGMQGELRCYDFRLRADLDTNYKAKLRTCFGLLDLECSKLGFALRVTGLD